MYFLILSYGFYEPILLSMHEKLGDCVDDLVQMSHVALGNYEIACIFIDKVAL